jgi:predicted O-methyltransferase YrrM
MASRLWQDVDRYITDTLVTLEAREKHAAVARANLARAGLSEVLQ